MSKLDELEEAQAALRAVGSAELERLAEAISTDVALASRQSLRRMADVLMVNAKHHTAVWRAVRALANLNLWE